MHFGESYHVLLLLALAVGARGGVRMIAAGMSAVIEVVFRAPHRAMFLGGVVQLLLAGAWWAARLTERLAPPAGARSLAAPEGWVHGAWMIFGVFPFFIFGFALTAAPRWQGAAAVARARYAASFALMALGWAVLLACVIRGAPGVAAGACLVLGGWAIAGLELTRVVLFPSPDRRHVLLLAAAVWMGWAAAAIGAAGLVAGRPHWLGMALIAGFWGCLLPIFTTVCHRMIPFFSGAVLPGYRAVRPFSALYAMLCAFAVHGILAGTGTHGWTWAVDLPAAAVAFALTRAWDLRRSFGVRLLAMLHLGFAWLGIGLALSALRSVLLLAGYSGMGLAPLHSLTMGFCASLVLAMVSRVTLGHSGLSLVADRATWASFWALQVTAVIRIGAEWAPDAWSHRLSLAAAIGWVAVFAYWASRYAPLYWRPRADGRPG